MSRKISLPSFFLILAYGSLLAPSPGFQEISAGVAILTFGMLAMEEGFRMFTGGVLEQLLRKTTDKLWKSIGFGVVSTAVMQSSAAVAIISISFLSAGLDPIGRRGGDCLRGQSGDDDWLVAGLGLKLKISVYAMPRLVFGLVLVFQQAKGLNGSGFTLSGLGGLLLGSYYMKKEFEDFKDAFDLTAYRSAFIPVFYFSR